MKTSDKTHREKLEEAYKALGCYAYNLTHNIDLAKDLLQETSVKIINGEKQYKENGTFLNWAMHVMKNTFNNDIRSKSNKMEKFVDGYNYFQDERQHPVVAENESPYTMNEIIKAMKMLPPVQYKMLVMRELGYKYEEIASLLNISVGTVKSKIFLAKTNLKKIMEGLR